MIALGVADPELSADFYARVLGLRVRSRRDGLITFETGPPRLCLYPAGDLAAFTGRSAVTPGPSTVQSLNVDSQAEVDRVVRAAVEYGGTLTRPAGALPWGGYGACISDPDGHVWEIVHAG